MKQGVSSCSSLGWPLLSLNSGCRYERLSDWRNLTPAVRCHAVNTAIMYTLLPCNQFYRGPKGDRALIGGMPSGHPLEPPMQ